MKKIKIVKMYCDEYYNQIRGAYDYTLIPVEQTDWITVSDSDLVDIRNYLNTLDRYDTYYIVVEYKEGIEFNIETIKQKAKEHKETVEKQRMKAVEAENKRKLKAEKSIKESRRNLLKELKKEFGE